MSIFYGSSTDDHTRGAMFEPPACRFNGTDASAHLHWHINRFNNLQYELMIIFCATHDFV